MVVIKLEYNDIPNLKEVYTKGIMKYIGIVANCYGFKIIQCNEEDAIKEIKDNGILR